MSDSDTAEESSMTESLWGNRNADVQPVMEIKAVVNGAERTSGMPLQMMEDRIMIAAQSVPDYFDAQVTWDISGGGITCSKNLAMAVFMVDSTTCLMNGASDQMERTPVIVDGCLFLPAREIAEGLGYQVIWNPMTNTIEFLENGGGADFFV